MDENNRPSRFGTLILIQAPIPSGLVNYNQLSLTYCRGHGTKVLDENTQLPLLLHVAKDTPTETALLDFIENIPSPEVEQFDQTKPKHLDEFILFPELPIELRLEIW